MLLSEIYPYYRVVLFLFLPAHHLSLTPTARILSMTFKTRLQKWQVIVQLKDFTTSSTFQTRICDLHTISFCNWYIFDYNLLQRLPIYLLTFQLHLGKPATPQFPDVGNKLSGCRWLIKRSKVVRKKGQPTKNLVWTLGLLDFCCVIEDQAILLRPD